MSKKLDLRTKMQELHKAYSAVAAELKEIEAEEKESANIAAYKDFKYKVFFKGGLSDTPTWQDVTDDDRATAQVGPESGLIYSGEFSTGAYMLFKTKEEYTRVKTLFDRIEAFINLKDKTKPNKEEYIKIILGEK